MSNLMCDRMCTVNDCPSHARKREMCQAHYRRWRLFGDPLGGDWAYKRPAAADVQAVFWSRVDKTETCWLWTGPPNSTGYGSYSLGGRSRFVHRLVWEWLVGEIPPKMTIDHLCRIRRCVNPAHLEVVTRQENCRRRSAR